MRLSRRSAPEPVQCHGYFHIIRGASLIFRTPTLHETRIARAGASDAQAQRWLGWPADHTYPEAQRAALLVSPSDGAADYRGRGLGRELFAAALTLGHQHLGMKTLRAGAEVTNHASRRSLEAAGFRRPPTPQRPHHSLPLVRALRPHPIPLPPPRVTCRTPSR